MKAVIKGIEFACQCVFLPAVFIFDKKSLTQWHYLAFLFLYLSQFMLHGVKGLIGLIVAGAIILLCGCILIYIYQREKDDD